MPIDSELLQVGLANVELSANDVLPHRLACNLASRNLAVITNPNLEDYHIVHLWPFSQTIVDGCLRVHLHVALISIHHCPISHLKLNWQLGQHFVRWFVFTSVPILIKVCICSPYWFLHPRRTWTCHSVLSAIATHFEHFSRLLPIMSTVY